MDTRPDLPARPEIGLAAAAHLELGLLALEAGQLPAALGSLAAIEESAWQAIVNRFTGIEALITKWSNPR
jgi:predicted negative regulator of RcsB-dependent stress response